jgi:hypothetical protein
MSSSKVLASVVAEELSIGAAVLLLVPFLEPVSRGSYFSAPQRQRAWRERHKYQPYTEDVGDKI